MTCNQNIGKMKTKEKKKKIKPRESTPTKHLKKKKRTAKTTEKKSKTKKLNLTKPAKKNQVEVNIPTPSPKKIKNRKNIKDTTIIKLESDESAEEDKIKAFTLYEIDFTTLDGLAEAVNHTCKRNIRSKFNKVNDARGMIKSIVKTQNTNACRSLYVVAASAVGISIPQAIMDAEAVKRHIPDTIADMIWELVQPYHQDAGDNANDGNNVVNLDEDDDDDSSDEEDEEVEVDDDDEDDEDEEEDEEEYEQEEEEIEVTDEEDEEEDEEEEEEEEDEEEEDDDGEESEDRDIPKKASTIKRSGNSKVTLKKGVKFDQSAKANIKKVKSALGTTVKHRPSNVKKLKNSSPGKNTI